MQTLLSLSVLVALLAPVAKEPADKLETTTGESFSGKLIGMANGQLNFESEAGGKILIPQGKVKSLTTDEVHEVVLKDGKKSQIKFDAAGPEDFFGISAISPEEAPRPWEASAALGASQSFGNSEVTQIVLAANGLYRLQGQDRLSGEASWLYNEEKNMTTKQRNITQRRLAGAVQYDKFFNEQLYGFARVSAENDREQGLELRFQPSVGLGYQFFDTPVARLSAEAGLAWRYEDYRGAGPDDSASVRVAVSYVRQLLDNLNYNLDAEWLPSLEDGNDHIVKMRNRLSSSLGGGFTAAFTWEFDHNSEPASGNKRNDHRFFLTVGVSF
ncbi:MAG: hypothetical protein CSA62_13255 [Planctomycetota bacterium]|nr:MAG: hypothetical protein CSA62_13255 [Planctomycetota bacterium]